MLKICFTKFKKEQHIFQKLSNETVEDNISIKHLCKDNFFYKRIKDKALAKKNKIRQLLIDEDYNYINEIFFIFFIDFQ